MNGSGAGVVGRPITVLVFEHVTGGGLAGRELPASWAVEGSAMRRAIALDFAAVAGVRVVMPVDPRLPPEDLPGVKSLSSVGDESGLMKLAAGVDYTLLIAPEADDVLANWTVVVEIARGRLLGPRRPPVVLCADKARLAGHFAARQVPTPPTVLLGPGSPGFPADWGRHVVVKPRRGAGSVDTVVVRDGRRPAWVPLDQSFVAQPYFPGRPMSASLLLDLEGPPTVLAVGRQRIVVDEAGRITYQGGSFPWPPPECPPAVLEALATLPGLCGFVGVDFLDDRGEVTVLEVNPRPTTSYVGLSRLFPPGTIAGAWLAAAEGPMHRTDWPDRLRSSRIPGLLAFDADGTIHPPTGDAPR